MLRYQTAQEMRTRILTASTAERFRSEVGATEPPTPAPAPPWPPHSAPEPGLQPTEPRAPRLSWTAVLGFIALPAPIITMVPVQVSVAPARGYPVDAGLSVLGLLLTLAVYLAPFVFGFYSIAAIRRSNGRLFGLGSPCSTCSSTRS